MSSIFEMKQQARALFDQEQFLEAVSLYQTLWSEHHDDCDEWDGLTYARSLRKLGRSEKALDICRQVYKMKPDFERNRNVYAWSIWDLHIKGATGAGPEAKSPEFMRAATAIVALVSPDQYSPYIKTVISVLKFLKDRKPYPAQQVLEWTDKVTPDQLSTEVWIGTDNKGRSIEHASERELWYAHRCKALLETGRLQECVDFANEAFTAVPKFHYDNDVWLRYHQALAMSRLGDNEVAVKQLGELLVRKKDWFIYRDIAQCLHELGRLDEALENALNAALAPLPEIENKWRLFLLMGLIFREKNRTEDAQKHVLLSARVRKKRSDWKRTPQELTQALTDLGVDVDSGPSTDDLERELYQWWMRTKLADRPKLFGEVTNLLPNGTAGFIRGREGEDYYFKIKSFKGPHHMLELGLPVEFFVEKNPDPGKRDIAVEVRPRKSKDQTRTVS